jgi:hypothetical protein
MRDIIASPLLFSRAVQCRAYLRLFLRAKSVFVLIFLKIFEDSTRIIMNKLEIFVSRIVDR